MEELESASRDISLSIAKNENHLEDLSLKLEEIANKTKLIKTEKESKALSLEEELAKEQITFANEEIARLNTLIESKKDSIDTLKEKINTLQIHQKEIAQKVEAEVEQVKEEQKKSLLKKNCLSVKWTKKLFHSMKKYANGQKIRVSCLLRAKRVAVVSFALMTKSILM